MRCLWPPCDPRGRDHAPITLEQPEAALLGLTVGEPAFVVKRISYVGEQTVELRTSIIRGDRYRFRVRLEGTGLTGPPD